MDAMLARLERVTTRLEKLADEKASSSGQAPAPRLPQAGHAAGNGVDALKPKAAAPAPQARAPAGAPATKAAPSGPASSEFATLQASWTAALEETARPLDPEVQAATECLSRGLAEMHGVIERFAVTPAPGPQALQELVKPVADQLVAAQRLAQGPRSRWTHHKNLVAESIQGFAWLVYTGPQCGMQTPEAHVGECWSSAELYANKVLMEYRKTDPQHVAWVGAVKAVFAGLREFVSARFPSGPVWGSGAEVPAPSPAPASAPAPAEPKKAAPTPAEPEKAAPDPAKPEKPAPAPAEPEKVVPTPVEAEEAAPAPENADKQPAAPTSAEKAAGADSAAPPAAVPAPKAGGPPPPPPPPKPGAFFENAAPDGAKPAKATKAASAAFLDELKASPSVTAGLRKVTDDMKTKNRADKAVAVVAGKAPERAAAPAAAAARRPPSMALQQRRWVVENYDSDNAVVLPEDQLELKHSVYIAHCRDCVVQIKAKVNNITLDNCQRVGLLFDAVVASCELVNCASVQVQCTGICPTLAIDKTDGVQVYLSLECLSVTEITMSKSSGVNMCVPPAQDEDDIREHPLPEQFISRFVDGKFVTEAVCHSGG